MRTENRCMWPGKQVSFTVSPSINSLYLIPNLPLQFTLLTPLSPGDLLLVTFPGILDSFDFSFLFMWFLSFLSALLLHLQPLFCLSFSLRYPGHFKAKRNSQKPPSSSKVFILFLSVGKPGIAVLWFLCVRSTITHPHLRATDPDALSLQSGRR